MKVKLSVIALLIVFGLSSCATIFTGTKDKITFNTNPSGAGVFIDGIRICTTPCSTDVKRSLNDTEVEFKLDGYETQVVTLDREFNVISILNFTGLVGWAVDAVTGSIFKYDRKSYDVELPVLEALNSDSIHMVEVDTANKIVAFHVIQK